MTSPRRLISAAIVVVVAWLTVGFWLGPFLIRVGYAAEGPDLLNGVFEGRASHPLEFYLQAWRSLVWATGAALCGAVGIAYLAVRYPERRRRFLRWLLRGRSPERGAVRSLDLFATVAAGVALGVAAGVLELFVLGIEWWIVGERPYLSGHVLWIAPLFNVILLVSVGIAWATAHRLVPWRAESGRTLALLVFVGATSALSALHPRVDEIAVLILSAGIGFRLGGLLERWVRRWHVPALVALSALAVTGVGVFGARWVSNAGQPSGSAEAGDGIHRNVILIVWDTVRSMSVGAGTSGESNTPNLDSLSRGGVRFLDAVAPAPWTLPSHASMFTGHWPHELSAGWRIPLDAAAPTLAEILSQEGYATAGFVANLIYGTRAHGLDRGFQHWEDYRLSLGEFVLSTSLGRYLSGRPDVRSLFGYDDILGRKSATQITEAFLEWEAEVDGPYFAFLNYFDAHEPYLPPPPFDTLIQHSDLRRTDLIRLWDREGTVVAKETLSVDEIAVERSAYEAAITYLDSELGRLVDTLSARGRLDETLVIVTSDHGEQFGERGYFTHGNTLYPEAVNVPLSMFSAGMPSGIEVDQPVSLRDLPATVLNAVAPYRVSAVDGRPLQELLSGPDTSRFVITELEDDGSSDPWNGAVVALVSDAHLLVWNGDRSVEAYAREGQRLRELSGVEAYSVREQFEWIRDSIPY